MATPARRTLRFNSFEDAVADARALREAPGVQSLGKWSPGENVDHVAVAIELAVNGYPPGVSPPWFVKLFGWVMKHRLVTRGFPTGVKPPPAMAALFTPRPGVSLPDAADRLEAAVAAFRGRGPIDANPLVGKLTPAQWEQFNCRHAELHFSFLLPAAG